MCSLKGIASELGFLNLKDQKGFEEFKECLFNFVFENISYLQFCNVKCSKIFSANKCIL